MGHRLRTIPAEGGLRLYEKACENYVCSSCGGSMVICNFVQEVGIQVFVLHNAGCGIYKGGTCGKPVEVDCRGCRYLNADGECTLEKEDERINSVRTGA